MTDTNTRMLGRWTRRSVMITVAIAVVALIGLGTALAFILASAEVEGSATGGSVALDWDGGALGIEALTFDPVTGDPDNSTPTLPTGVTASASITATGNLSMTFDNVFPGDGFLIGGSNLANNSTLDVNLLQWVYNADTGPKDSGAPIEVYLAEWNGSSNVFEEVSPATFGTIASAGGSTSPLLVFVEFTDAFRL